MGRAREQDGPCVSRLNTRSISPISTPAHEARGDPGSAVEEALPSSMGFGVTTISLRLHSVGDRYVFEHLLHWERKRSLNRGLGVQIE